MHYGRCQSWAKMVANVKHSSLLQSKNVNSIAHQFILIESKAIKGKPENENKLVRLTLTNISISSVL
jgi:hypothetical protein